MQADVLAGQGGPVDAELLGVREDVGQRDPGGFLHHLAELSGECQSQFAVHRGGLDIEHVPAGASDRKPGGHPGHRSALGGLPGRIEAGQDSGSGTNPAGLRRLIAGPLQPVDFPARRLADRLGQIRRNRVSTSTVSSSSTFYASDRYGA